MGSPIIMAYDSGESFSSINTLTLGVGVAWGTCLIAYRNLDFRREALDVSGLYVGLSTDEEIFNQYCNLDRESRERIHLPRRTSTKSVHGISFGLNAGGALDLFDSVSEAVLRPVFRELLSNTVGLSGLTVGTAGGFMNMFDAGVFHGINGHTNFSININNFPTYEYCLVQFGVGALVSAALNILLIGNFRNLTHYIVDVNNMPDNFGLVRYLYNVMTMSRCYAVIGEASAGLILPGGSVNIVAT